MYKNKCVMGCVSKTAVALAILGLSSLWPTTATASEMWAATEYGGRHGSLANKEECQAAGKEIGQNLKEGCKGHKPDFIFVSSFAWGVKGAENNQGILDGVAESFDKKILYGFTNHGNFSQKRKRECVGVLALGGDIKTTTAKVALRKGEAEAAYTVLAEALEAQYIKAAGKGRLILLLGPYPPGTSGQQVMNGFANVLGKDVQIFGTMTPFREPEEFFFQCFQGEVLQNNLVAILLTGEFTCSFAMGEATPESPEKVIASAETAIVTAIGKEKKDDAILMLLDDSVGRIHYMEKTKQKAEEVKTLTQTTQIPIFGWCGNIQVGHPVAGVPPVAKINQISVCVIRKTASDNNLLGDVLKAAPEE